MRILCTLIFTSLLVLFSFSLNAQVNDEEKLLNAKKARLERISNEFASPEKYSTLNKKYSEFKIALGMLNGSSAPFKSTFNMGVGWGNLVYKKRINAEAFIDADFYQFANSDWYKQSLKPRERIDEFFVSSFISADAGIALMPVFFNNDKKTIVIGPEIGIRWMTLRDRNVVTNYSFTDPNFLNICYGLKSKLYLGDLLIFIFEYSLSPTKVINATSKGLLPTTTNLNCNMIRFGIGIRFWG